MLAIIPARGGSKGIPGKNKKMFAGKPLIQWTIETAFETDRIDNVIVSTDDEEISRIALAAGATVITRPEELSGDYATSETAIKHVLKILQQETLLPEAVVFLQCTSPLILPEDLQRGLEKFKTADTVVAVTEFTGALWNKNGAGINHNPEQIRQPRQKIAKQYLETGAFYIFDTKLFLEKENRFCGKVDFVEIPKERSLEIDTPLDFEITGRYKREQIRWENSNKIPKNLKLVVFDFDGVFTDNKVLTTEDGKEGVITNKGDGLALSEFPWNKYGIDVMVLSSEKNSAGLRRCEKFPRVSYFRSKNKLQVLKKWAKKPEQVIYVGNDRNDLDCMRWVGCAVAPADAYPEIQSNADIVLESKGGDGVIRELLELIIARRR